MAHKSLSPNGLGSECQMDLPYDTIVEILNCLDNYRSYGDATLLYTKTTLQPTLFAACLLSRRWNEAGTPILYENVLLPTSRSLRVFLATLQNREDFRSYVRSVFFTRAFSDEGEDWINFEKYEDLDLVYSLCPNIHFRRISSDESVKNTSMHGIHSGWEGLNFRTLTRLDFHTSGNVPETFSPALSLPGLEDLIVRGWKMYSGRRQEPRWPVMPRLWRLCLYKCEFQPVLSCLPDFPPGHKGLRVLEIIGGDYVGYGLMSAIRRRCRSLELFTFITFSTCEFYNGPPSVTTLRISSSHMNLLTVRSHLPPNLVHLIGVRSRSSQFRERACGLVEALTEMYGSGAYPHLKTIQISDTLTTQNHTSYERTSKLLKEAGLKFVLTDPTLGAGGYLSDYLDSQDSQ